MSSRAMLSRLPVVTTSKGEFFRWQHGGKIQAGLVVVWRRDWRIGYIHEGNQPSGSQAIYQFARQHYA